MIGPISRERFEKRYMPKIPNPDLVARHWFENTVDQTLGYVAYNQPADSWVAIVLKKRRGHFRVWRQTTSLVSEKEAIGALRHLFELTDRGYSEKSAEEEFFAKPNGKQEFMVVTDFGFDPSYDRATKAKLDAPLSAIAQKYFARIFPSLQAHLRANPGQKSAISMQGFPTPFEVGGAPVLGLFYITTDRVRPDEIRVYAGNEGFINSKHKEVLQHWEKLKATPGIRMLTMEGNL